jgi:hypothetical protein
MLIKNFSAGFGYRPGLGNGIASTLLKESLRYAQGFGDDDLLKSIENKGKTGNAVLDEDIRLKRKRKRAIKNKKKSKKAKTSSSSSSSSSSSLSVSPVTTIIKEEKETEFVITCDGCGQNCTKESYYVKRTKEDYCNNCCIKLNYMNGILPQMNGVNVKNKMLKNKMMALIQNNFKNNLVTNGKSKRRNRSEPKKKIKSKA